MKSKGVVILGVCFALLEAAVLADDDVNPPTTSGDADSIRVEQQSGAETGAASGASEAGTRGAGTATAVGAIYEAVKEGKIKIKGGTDPGAPDF